MGRNVKKKCTHCSKEFRSDYLKKHELKCANKENKENTCDDNTPEVRQRLNDLAKASENNRLKELSANLSDCGKCKHCQVFYLKKDVANHEKKCPRRIEKCFICKQEFIADVLFKEHIPVCRLNKKLSKKKTTKPTPKPKPKPGPGPKPNKKKKKKKRNRGGTQFKLQFHGAKKYKIFRRLCVMDRSLDAPYYTPPDWIKQFLIGNEFGAGPVPNPHCHAVLVTKKKITFEDLKKKWKQKTRIRINDIQSCKDIRQDIRYTTKEDYRPLNFNFDWDLMNLGVKAYLHATKHSRLSQHSYPYMQLPAHQKKTFEKLFLSFRDEIEQSLTIGEFEGQQLLHWQKQIECMVKNHLQNDREVTWIVDVVGNAGKTYLSHYLSLYYDCFSVDGDGLSKKDFALAYDSQEIVVIDFPRHMNEEYVCYGVIEALKNGSIWSPKYESKVKRFKHKKVQVFCFSNFYPDKTKLSPDRWSSVFVLNDMKIKRHIL